MKDTPAKSEKRVCELKFRGGSKQAAIVLISDFPSRIGRSPQCEVVIDEPSVSAVHAILRNIDGALVLEDQSSTNGIYQEGHRVSSVIIDKPLKLIFGNISLEAQPRSDDQEKVSASGAAKGKQQCLYKRNGEEFGPYSWNELQELARSGLLRKNDLVWIPKASGWMRAEYMPGLFSGRRHVSAEADIPAADELSTVDRENIQTQSRLASRSGKQAGIICPHCWHRFEVEEFLFIARHQTLVSDPVVGADAQQRFLPSRFTPEGNAVDSAGMSCPDMACPRCHLRIPQAAGEMPPLFLSIVGATASGKSYFLTGLTWHLRNRLARDFAITFTDTDAVNNQILNDFEETLYLHADSEELVALRKTELQGDLYNQVYLDNMIINLPKPFMFTVTPAEHHPDYEAVRRKMSRTLVLYDNAGEHFEPGMDSVDNPTTQHLLHSDAIFFLFDPSKDVRFRRLLGASPDPQLAKGARVQRQEIILTEMINRVKKYSGMRSGAKAARTMIVVVSKYDLWSELLDMKLPEQPWQWNAELGTAVLDVDLIKRVSYDIRCMLDDSCPEMVSTAESFAGDVLYLPNSALGHSPELSRESGMIGIRPQDIHPVWVSVPMLYFFYQQGFIPAAPVQPDSQALQPLEYKISGDVVFVKLPGHEKPLQIPIFYLGSELRSPQTRELFKMPSLDDNTIKSHNSFEQ